MISLQAATETDLKGILDLQKRNLKEHLPLAIRKKEGFLTVQHDLELLSEMNTLLPHVVALYRGRVIGYALSMVREMHERLPVLETMFEKINDLAYNGVPLARASYYIMGQVCIDEKYRGQGLFRALYDKHKELYSDRFDYFITEVSDGNVRSLRAHHKIGFSTILEYEDLSDHWHLILWDWKS